MCKDKGLSDCLLKDGKSNIPLSFIVFGLIVSAFTAYGSAWFLEKIRSTGLLIVCISPMLLVMSKYQIERILLKHRAVVYAKNSYAETDEVYLLQGRELVLFMKKVLSLWHYLPLAAVSFYAAFCFVADEKITREFNIITMIVWFILTLKPRPLGVVSNIGFAKITHD